MYTKILGYKVFNGTKEEFIKEILKRNKSNIISGNPEILFNGLNDEKLNSTFNAEDAIIIPDGVGTVIASKLVKDPVKEKIAGIEVMHEVLLQSVKEGKGIYLLGAEEEVLQSCVKNIKRDIKGINIVGVHNGFFDLNNCEDLINDIKSKNPWAIFVAMGSPRQEKFINLIKDDTNCKVYMGVGGSFDIFAGKLNDKKRISNAISLLCVAFTLVLLISGGFVRERLKVNGAELNDAITCLTKIINDEKKFSWTIISANDENRMARDSGFHYEIIRLLDNMEYVGARGRVCIPTENVFVFIEKIPGDYYQPYENSGQSISEAGCENRLPMSQGLSCYQGENRWIVMSRAYAWANKFMELYPNEVSVYWESDEFICYKIVQNPYRLFNFAIDYDYNLRVYPVREEIEE